MTIGGRGRPTTPSAHVTAPRSRYAPVSSATHCFCSPFTFNTTPSPAYGFFDEAFDVCVCADSIHMSITADQAWDPTDGGFGGPFPDNPSSPPLRMELRCKPLTGPANSGIYLLSAYYDSPSTLEFRLRELSGAFSHLAPGQPTFMAGDTVELTLTGLRSTGLPINITAKVNGSTILSDSRVPDHSQLYDPSPTPICGMTVLMYAVGQQDAAHLNANVTYSDWLAEGSC